MRTTSILRAVDPPSLTKSLQYATNLVRSSDIESFYPSLFYPSTLQPAYLAIRALNVELASIDESVTNGMVGKLRYEWWRNGITSALQGQKNAHPVLNLLASLKETKRMSSYHFKRLVDARERNFLDPRFLGLQELAEYSAGTQASLLYLLLQTTESNKSGAMAHTTPFEHTGSEHLETSFPPSIGKTPVTALTLDHAASHLAVAITISIILRSIPHHAVKRINQIPTEIGSRHGLTDEGLFRKGPLADGLRESVATLVGIAQAELKTSRECFEGTEGIPAHVKSVFLSATPARSFLERLSNDKVAFNVFDGSLQKRYWKLPFQVWADSRRAMY